MTAPGGGVRFDAVTRAAHWATAALALVLLATGTVLYVPELSAAVGRRTVLKEVHVWAGGLLFVPLVIAVLAGRAGRRLRYDLHDLGRWTDGDGAWVRAWVRRRPRPETSGKFNGGQKLATALFGGFLAVQLMTGSLMNWNRPFPDSWRTGATFVHDWVYLFLLVLTAGHILEAARQPELLSAMVHGRARQP